jgi:hypothetical protein
MPQSPRDIASTATLWQPAEAKLAIVYHSTGFFVHLRVATLHLDGWPDASIFA